MISKKNIISYLTVISLFVYSSCANLKQTKYFQDISDSKTAQNIDIAKFVEPIIQTNDILAITINTIDPAASAAFNAGNTIQTTQGVNISNSINQQLISGYLVDNAGNVDLPLVGKVKLVGLTIIQAKELLRVEIEKFYKNPSVNIRYANFKITVLGEVNRPASYAVPNEQVSILDALGYAGDLTIYGKRTNVLLIRKQPDGKSVNVRLDLTKKDVLNSPYYYLKQNDVVYVQPVGAKLANTDTAWTRYLSLAATLVTVYVLLITQTSLGGN